MLFANYLTRSCQALLLSTMWAGCLWAGGTVVSSGGFEGPDFAAGNLAGQQSWVTAGNGTTSAVIQNAKKESGNQAVAVQRTSGSDRRWAIPVNGLPTGRFVTISWDMAVTVTQAPGVFGPFFGVEAYDEVAGIPRLIGSLGVDATTGEVLYQLEDTGFLATPGPTVASNAWNHFDIVLDFLTDEYSTFLNGALLVGGEGFVDRGFGLNRFTDADISAFSAAGDSSSIATPGTAWFDNFIVVDGIPGDYDGDDRVGAGDYVVWRNNEGANGVGALGDGNGDGEVDDRDYDLWAARYGSVNLVPGAGAASTIVPEPQSIVMLLLALVGLAPRRRSVRR